MKFNKHQLRRISPYLLIGAFYFVAFFAIGIAGDFPLNDDWAYAEGVRHLLLGEGLIMPNVCAAGIAHVALGFLFAKVLGYSFVSLRICSFLVTIVGAIAFYVAAASLRIPRAAATFLTLLYAANPILLNVAFGFMSDSTALALNMVFLALLTRGLAKNSLKTVALAFVVLAVAVSVRQSALIFLVLIPLCLSKRFGAEKNRFVYFAASIILPLASAAACDHWLMTSYVESGSVNIGYDLVKKAHSDVVQKFLFAAPEMAVPVLSAVIQVL
ncbi:MAG: glycosyltransferase family 39 protein [Candidatus Obscuribacterales bacterium]